jgi:hypothetical protein
VSQATVSFSLGAESVTVPLDINLQTETIITGDFGGVVPAGTVARLRGNVRLIDNLHVRGTLLCDPTGVDLDGQNLYDIHTHDGTLNLQGVQKSAWVNWGDTPTGWQVGDRLAVAPTAAGVYAPSETTWQGTWSATIRPATSSDLTLADGSIARPEVVNLAQTVTLRNLKRVMVHEASAPNPQTFKWIRVLNSGEAGVLGMYPIHFHMIGDHARGSVLEGVVVEGGKNHAFVPHASHGITFTQCVAYNIVDHAYWWDPPPDVPGPRPTINDSHDIFYDRCLAGLLNSGPVPDGIQRLSGFYLTHGAGNRAIGCVAFGVLGGISSSGFVWPETGSSVWEFRDCLAHNNKKDGIFTWQNSPNIHLIEDFTAYRCGKAGIEHGAYRNPYQYRGAVLTDNGVALLIHALSKLEPPSMLFEDMITNGVLEITKHRQTSTLPSIYRRGTFTQVRFRETDDGGNNPGTHWFEDCGLVPAQFDLAGILPGSVIEIFEGGALVHRWAGGWL